jgi:hypothetical protein
LSAALAVLFARFGSGVRLDDSVAVLVRLPLAPAATTARTTTIA